MGNGFALEKLTSPEAAPDELYVFMLGLVARALPPRQRADLSPL